jgi:hypothetical protein
LAPRSIDQPDTPHVGYGDFYHTTGNMGRAHDRRRPMDDAGGFRPYISGAERSQ